ncbi:MAG: hypothetical protein V4645_18225 [Pseudomonadota bacterium]
MKSTIKIDPYKAVVIEPDGQGVKLSIRIGSVVVGSLVLRKELVGAVLAGIEHAAGRPAPML